MSLLFVNLTGSFYEFILKYLFAVILVLSFFRFVRSLVIFRVRSQQRFNPSTLLYFTQSRPKMGRGVADW